jgi:hypothetical protein
VRQQINRDTNRVFREETGIARELGKPKDRPLSHHWLRIRDGVMSER